jgi:hypothetical protein
MKVPNIIQIIFLFNVKNVWFCMKVAFLAVKKDKKRKAFKKIGFLWQG